MADQVSTYKNLLGLSDATFERIDHSDAMVACTYKINLEFKKQLILKVCPRSEDYRRELYFLEYFSDLLPVPHIVQHISPTENLSGAILMECLPGNLLRAEDLTNSLAHEIGVSLAGIHSHKTEKYGDLTQPKKMSGHPRIPFCEKFKEGLEECKDHLPTEMLDRCTQYLKAHLKLFDTIDGPCMIHRDFRPGNIIVHNGKLSGIIDWSSARSSFAEDDLCPLEHGEWPLQNSHRKSFFEGYSSIRPVPLYHDIMPLLRLHRALAVVGFTLKQGTWTTIHSQPYRFNRRFIDQFFDSSIS